MGILAGELKMQSLALIAEAARRGPTAARMRSSHGLGRPPQGMEILC